jgi:hypothetical protein
VTDSASAVGWEAALRSFLQMTTRVNQVFGVSYRVQIIGVLSLLAVPVVLAAVAWALIYVSPWLAVAVGLALVIGLQAALATATRNLAVGRPRCSTCFAALERTARRFDGPGGLLCRAQSGTGVEMAAIED